MSVSATNLKAYLEIRLQMLKEQIENGEVKLVVHNQFLPSQIDSALKNMSVERIDEIVKGLSFDPWDLPTIEWVNRLSTFEVERLNNAWVD